MSATQQTPVEATPTTKKLRLFFRSAEYLLKYYPGTTRDELLAAILSVLRVEARPGTNVLFVDDAADPVALSASAMPDGLKLSVQLEQPPPTTPAPPTPAAPPTITTIPTTVPMTRDVPTSITNTPSYRANPGPRKDAFGLAQAQQTIATVSTTPAAPTAAAAAAPLAPIWHWDASSRTCTDHFVSDNGLKTGQTFNTGFGGVRGNLSLGDGMHLWTIFVDKSWCCCYAGVTGAGEQIGIYDGKWAVSLQSLAEQDRAKVFYSDTGCPQLPLHIAFVLDGDTHVLRVFRLNSEGQLPTSPTKCFLRINQVPSSVYPIVRFKHEISFTLTSACRPQQLPWVDTNDVDRVVARPTSQ